MLGLANEAPDCWWKAARHSRYRLLHIGVHVSWRACTLRPDENLFISPLVTTEVKRLSPGLPWCWNQPYNLNKIGLECALIEIAI